MLQLSRMGASVAFLLAASSSLHAETILNTTTPLDQERQSVAQLANGTVVCVWEDDSIASGRILLRRFNSNLVALDNEQRIDLSSGEGRGDPVVASLPGGGFVVAYDAIGLDASNYGVAFRTFDANAQALDTVEKQANILSAASQFHPQAAALDNGGFVLCWLGQSGGTGQNVFYRRFSANGVPVESTEVLANGLGNDPVTLGDQGSARIAALKDGGFVIVYEDRASDDVYGVHISSNGTALDAPGEPAGNKQFLLSTNNTYEQTAPDVSGLALGGFIVTYNTEASGTAASRRVMARVFDANGAGGPEFTIGFHTNRWQDARLAGLPNGDYAASWQALTQEPNPPMATSWAVFEQSFSRTGIPRAAPSQVNVFDIGNQDTPSITALSDSGYMIGWESFGQDTSGYGILGQGYPAVAATPGILSIARSGGTASVFVGFAGTPGRNHELQVSSGLLTWNGILVTNTPDGTFQYIEPHSQPSRLFRVRSQ